MVRMVHNRCTLPSVHHAPTFLIFFLLFVGEYCSEADPAYLSDFYDRIADNFEEKLVLHLGYRGPWILHEMVLEALSQEVSPSTTLSSHLSSKGQYRILDLGCGSGLCGRIFNYLCSNREQTEVVTVDDTLRVLKEKSESASNLQPDAAPVDIIVPIASLSEAIPLSGPLMAGIDISHNMIKVSSNPSNHYNLLTCGHLIEGLEAFQNCSAEKLDIVIAADTFIYVGALGRIFKLISEVLKSNGLLVFSTEILNSDSTGAEADMPIALEVDDFGELLVNEDRSSGFSLLDSARFGHSSEYIKRLCTVYNFSVVSIQNHMLRTESSVPLPGLFYVLMKGNIGKI